MRLLLFVVLSGGIACVTHARGELTLSARAREVANSTYVKSMREMREAGLCVASRGYAWGWARDGRMWVTVTKFATEGRQVARVTHATLRRLQWERNICGDSLPALHTHLPPSTLREPSLCDQQALAQRPKVPFHLVQVGYDSIVVYYIEPGTHATHARDSTNHCRE